MKRSLGIAVLVLATCLASLAQAPALSEARLVSRVSPQVATFSFQSLLMGREMTFQVVSPPKSNRPTKNKGPEPIYPVLYLLHGLSGHYDNWSTKTKLAEYAATYKWVIVLPEGGDGWYTDSATVPNDRFESYIVRELIPMTSRDLRANRQSMAIAGLSMGGYGAIKFGLKYPDLFSLAGSFSGAFDAPMRTAKNGNNWPSIPAVFGPEGSKTRAENDIFSLIRDLPSDRVSTLPFI
jgi:S-formylglutathione hydrolase FrmB